jgi:galactonate dehydratase
MDIDGVVWQGELFIRAPIMDNGELIVPRRPGWGVELNEAAV